MKSDYETALDMMAEIIGQMRRMAEPKNDGLGSESALKEQVRKLVDDKRVLVEQLNALAAEIDRKDEMIEKQSRALAIYRVPTPRDCPFCGGPAEIHQLHKDEWYVACGNDSCPVNPETNCFDTETDAIEAWNNSYNTPKVTCDWR